MAPLSKGGKKLNLTAYACIRTVHATIDQCGLYNSYPSLYRSVLCTKYLPQSMQHVSCTISDREAFAPAKTTSSEKRAFQRVWTSHVGISVLANQPDAWSIAYAY